MPRYVNKIFRTEIPIYTVDAFTSSPFTGNPAAVCLLEDDISDHLKQKIAAEMNISETAFVTKAEGSQFSSESKFSLRWFTPLTEVYKAVSLKGVLKDYTWGYGHWA